MSAVDHKLMMELRDVSLSFHSGRKTYDHGQHHVLHEVSLKIYEGETLGIIGRNGVGKTTMLRIMAGILAPNSGEARRQKRFSGRSRRFQSSETRLSCQ